MSDLRVASLRGRKAGTAPKISGGAVITGVTTSTSFSGNVTGNATGAISATSASLSGNVSVGGVITYEDVTNIDSVGVITARNGIKVSAGQSVSAVSGIVTYYGDGSKLSGVESGVVNFVASGTIANGATVVINTDGTVGIVTRTASTDPDNPDAGTPVVFNSGTTQSMSSTYDSNSNKVVIAYRDGGNNDYGTAIVGTVTPTTNSISFGTPVVFNSSDRTDLGNGSVVYDSSNNKVVIAYKDHGNSYYGTAIVGTVSGTSISFGSEVVFESANASDISATFDSNSNKVVIVCSDNGNSAYGTAIVGTVSGTSISFGTAVVFESASSSTMSATFDSNSNKVVIAYRDSGNSGHGTAIVGTVSGTSISFGTAVVFESGSTEYIKATFDSSNNKVVIAYKDTGNSNYGTAIVGTVSGTSISFGTPVVFESATTEFTAATFDSNSNKVVVTYNDGGNSNYGTAIVGTVSGTSISFGTPVVFESGSTEYIKATFDSTGNKVVIAYADDGNSDYGTAVVFDLITFLTNLTAENYIGIAAEAISDTATGRINVVTGTNTGQTGLTTAQKYYVQSSGGISTTASSPSVVAGTAISDTKIIVQKS